MGGRTRELALCAALLLAGCTSRAPVAAPGTSASATPSAPASGSVVPSVTPSPPERPTVLGVLGDYGVDGQPVRRVVALMAHWHATAIVTTGDDAYGAGRPHEAAFARRVLAPVLTGGARLYASLGNHDEATAGGAYVRRSLGMPASWYAARVGPVQLVVLDANRPYDAAQRAFIKRTLAAPHDAWRVVVFHQPAMSCSFHPPDAGVEKAWLPLFRGKVDLVLNGHNHTYERFAGPGGTPYVTTGGGGAPLYPSVPPCHGPGTVRRVRTAYHAVRLTVTAHALRLDAVGLDGTAFDTLRLSR
jgi:hypothetical protein